MGIRRVRIKKYEVFFPIDVMIEMSDFKNAGNNRGGGIRIDMDEDVDLQTDYEHDKGKRKGPPYAAFNETRQKT